eukprot:NODE_4169_length_703_cov_210.330247.p3 GENE.NODE_4169_length_703_cov_210.330247~~NODE_4169_length_703_cov_210.330247.p3  ORF type:complete len:97 (-),score=46.05 NODE_4169_length_703_cov_210.330247:395-685(-)
MGISLEEFTSQLETPAMHEFFKANEIDPGEAEQFFELIAGSVSTSIQMKDFRESYHRLQRPPKRVDVLVLQLGLIDLLETVGELVDFAATPGTRAL